MSRKGAYKFATNIQTY